MKQLLTLSLIIFIGLPTVAQTDRGEYWTSGCDTDASAIFEPIMGQKRYAAACDALKSCMPQNTAYGVLSCEFPVYDALVSECPTNDDACDFESSFYMASLLIFDPSIVRNTGFTYEPAEMQKMEPTALASFQAGDYQAVIDMYRNVYPPEADHEPRSPMLGFIVSLLVDKGMGNPNAVSTLYLDSTMNARTPFTTYQRARYLAELGFTDAAGVEGLYLEQLAEKYPLARRAADEISTNYPFPAELVEDWILYPVEGILEGATIGDLSMLTGNPIQLAFLSSGSLLIIGLPGGLQSMMQFSDMEKSLFLLNQGSENSYSYNRDIGGNNAHVFIQFEDNFATMNWRYTGIMEIVDGSLMLGKAGEPDPRVGYFERCEGGARWRLSVGDYGAPYYGYDADYTHYQYYDAPDGKSVAPFSQDISKFQVTDGPVCINGEAWWQINLLTADDGVYWIPEAEDISSESYKLFSYLYYKIAPPQ